MTNGQDKTQSDPPQDPKLVDSYTGIAILPPTARIVDGSRLNLWRADPRFLNQVKIGTPHN